MAIAFAPILLHARNPGPMTGAGNNTYLLVGRNGSAALIDAGTGVPEHLSDLDAALVAHDARRDAVFVTHAHPDHATGAVALAAAHPTAVFANRPWPAQDGLYPVRWRALEDGDTVGAGDEALTVLHTPGHSPDHLAFWHEPTRTALTGDLVVRGSSVMIHWSQGGNLSQYLASLERLLALDPAVLLPAHGPRIDEPRALLLGYLEHRLLRERQVLDALEAGHASVQAIGESIYHGLVPTLMLAALENVRAHLEKLKTDGLVTEESGQWRR